VSIALKQVSVEPVPPSQINPEVSPALEAVVMRSLAKEPTARFASADDFIAALQQARVGIAPAPAPPANGPLPTATALVVPPLPGPEDGARDAEEAARRRKRAWWIAGGVAAAAIVAAILLLLLLPSKTGQATVPDVTGETQTAAVASLRGAGLLPVVSTAANAHVAVGLVIGTTPPHGTVVKKGSRVSVFVSSGPGILALPNVNGKKSAEAVKILREKGFLPTVQDQSSDTVAKGLVISTDPAADTEVQVGGPVTVLVSTGPQEVTVPEVANESQANATATLSAAGLKVIVVKREVTEPAPGTVISQTPAAGSRAKAGAQVTIVVAQAPAKTPVPSVTGQSEVEAEATLSGAGFKVKTVTREVTDASKVGFVVQQSPEAEHQLAKGATVTIAVGKLSQQTTSTATTPTPTPPAAGAPAGP
jgi:serine/threonine-protein kinase